MKVEKPWGYEVRWAINEKYLGKLLFIKEGNRLSRQYHEVKDETIYVLEGSLLLELGPHISVPEQESIKETVSEGQSRRIHPGMVHRFCAEAGDVVLIEVSTPEIDDVVRLSDDYGRGEKEDTEELYAIYGGD
ncbi:MAG: cupin [Gammaproteobacteria bacterium]|nr:cupin [Gammaproteobacteria bacterium]|tara:strand:+ start:1275 stop:1673 length:399 start_codon:yes stop_codon:yes gene_type:complete